MLAGKCMWLAELPAETAGGLPTDETEPLRLRLRLSTDDGPLSLRGPVGGGGLLGKRRLGVVGSGFGWSILGIGRDPPDGGSGREGAGEGVLIDLLSVTSMSEAETDGEEGAESSCAWVVCIAGEGRGEGGRGTDDAGGEGRGVNERFAGTRLGGLEGPGLPETSSECLIDCLDVGAGECSGVFVYELSGESGRLPSSIAESTPAL